MVRWVVVMRVGRVHRDEPDERGFTLIELMIVVAIVAILAAIAVPLFLGEARKTKADSEVMAMFAEMSAKQESYKGEIGTYLTVPVCPATPSAQPQSIAACTASPAWISLGLLPSSSELRCSYEVTTGAAGVSPSPPGFTLPAAPANGWYYIIATCDMDGNPAINGTFMQSSLDTTIQKLNAAH